jgi:hypothetical protein
MIFEIRNESQGVNGEPKVYVGSMMSAGEGAAGMSEMLFISRWRGPVRRRVLARRSLIKDGQSARGDF